MNGNIPLNDNGVMKSTAIQGGLKLISADYDTQKFRFAMEASGAIHQMGQDIGQLVVNAGKAMSSFGLARQKGIEAVQRQDDALADQRAVSEAKYYNSKALSEVNDSAMMKINSGEISTAEEVDAFCSAAEDSLVNVNCPTFTNKISSERFSKNEKLYKSVLDGFRYSNRSEMDGLNGRMKSILRERDRQGQLSRYSDALANGDISGAVNAAEAFYSAGGDSLQARRMISGAHDTAFQNELNTAISLSGGDNEALKQILGERCDDYRNKIGNITLNASVLEGINRDSFKDKVAKFNEYISGDCFDLTPAQQKAFERAAAPIGMVSLADFRSFGDDVKYQRQEVSAGKVENVIPEVSVGDLREQAFENVDKQKAENDKKTDERAKSLRESILAKMEASLAQVDRIKKQKGLNDKEVAFLKKKITDEANEDLANVDVVVGNTKAMNEEAAKKERVRVESQIRQAEVSVQKQARELRAGILEAAGDENEFQNVIQNLIDLNATGKEEDAVLEFIGPKRNEYRGGTGKVDEAESMAIVLSVRNNLKNYSEKNDPSGAKMLNAFLMARFFCTDEDCGRVRDMLVSGTKVPKANAEQLRQAREMLRGAIGESYTRANKWFSGKTAEWSGKDKHKRDLEEKKSPYYSAVSEYVAAESQLLKMAAGNPDGLITFVQQIAPSLKEKFKAAEQAEVMNDYLKRVNDYVIGDFYARIGETAAAAHSDVKEGSQGGAATAATRDTVVDSREQFEKRRLEEKKK